MANKVLAGISLGLCLVALGLNVGSFNYPNWTNYEIGPDESYEYGLLVMTDEDNVDGEPDSTGRLGMCNAQFWCAFEDEFDDINAYESLCDTAKNSVRASIAYYVTICLANVTMVGYMVSQISIILERDPGHRFTMFGKAIMFPILDTIAFALWWGIGGARYDNDCEWEDVSENINDGDTFEQCAGPGATFSIIAFCFTFAAGAFAIANSFFQRNNIEIGYSNQSPMCCGPKIHFGIMLFFLLAVMGVSIGLWFIHWVHFEIDQNGIDDDWDGRINGVEDYDITPQVNIDFYGWDCLSIDPCDVDDDSTDCKSFDPLQLAGWHYLHLEVTSLFFVVLMTAFLFQVLLFSKEWAHPVLVYGFAHLQWIFQLVAIVGWAAMSEVKFEMDDCKNDDVDSDEAYDICIREGPVISIIQLFIQVMVACYFSVIYYNRGISLAPNTSPTVQTEESQVQDKSVSMTSNRTVN